MASAYLVYLPFVVLSNKAQTVIEQKRAKKTSLTHLNSDTARYGQRPMYRLINEGNIMFDLDNIDAVEGRK